MLSTLNFSFITVRAVIVTLSIHAYITVADLNAFCVQKTKSFVSEDYDTLVQVDSLLRCAATCSVIEKCKGSTYISETGICMLAYTRKETTQSENGVILWKHQKVEDCNDLPPGSPSGVYSIFPGQSPGISVYCDMNDDNGGWTIMQRRINGSTNFNRNWIDYKNGFGEVNWEYWIGNENMYVLTSNKNYSVKFDLEANDNDTAFAEYAVFSVESENTNYTLTIEGYSGNAGNSMKGVQSINGMMFTTYDRDNDENAYRNCAVWKKGGWWFQQCCQGNMNGLYKPNVTSVQSSIHWRTFKDWASLKAVSMKIRPTQNVN